MCSLAKNIRLPLREVRHSQVFKEHYITLTRHNYVHDSYLHFASGSLYFGQGSFLSLPCPAHSRVLLRVLSTLRHICRFTTNSCELARSTFINIAVLCLMSSQWTPVRHGCILTQLVISCKSLFLDIYCCIDITIMNIATPLTRPLTIF